MSFREWLKQFVPMSSRSLNARLDNLFGEVEKFHTEETQKVKSLQHELSQQWEITRLNAEELTKMVEASEQKASEQTEKLIKLVEVGEQKSSEQTEKLIKLVEAGEQKTSEQTEKLIKLVEAGEQKASEQTEKLTKLVEAGEQKASEQMDKLMKLVEAGEQKASEQMDKLTKMVEVGEQKASEQMDKLTKIIEMSEQKASERTEKLIKLIEASEQKQIAAENLIKDLQQRLTAMEKWVQILEADTKTGITYLKEKRYNNANKRIAFFAFESFHYEVLENMIKICNPKDNYLIAYVFPEAKAEVSKVLGESSALIEWHDYLMPNLPFLTEDMTPAVLREKFIIDALSKHDLNYVIIPSPEYHPEWYMPLVNSQDKEYELIAGMHNLNSNLFAELRDQNIELFFEKADSYAVIGAEMRDYLMDRGIQKKIYVFPPIYEPGLIRKQKTEKIHFVVTGGVEEKRRNYQIIVDALNKVDPAFYPKMKLVLLGRATSPYAKMILDELHTIEMQGLEVLSFSKYVPNETFSEELNKADFLIAPVTIETEYLGCKEYYGKTKISGVIGNIIHYAVPAIVNKELDIPDDLSDSIIKFESVDDLAEIFSRILTDESIIETYHKKILENCKRFALQNYIWS